MILDGYQTIVGSKFKRTDNVETTLKTLSTTNRLTQLSDQGVFGVTYENGEAIPSFVFPITVKNFKGQTITVFDQRHYTNKKGQKAQPKSKPLHYISSDGFDIYVGKNNFQNDELTFKFATGNDWWFHAKKMAGSHVIVRTKDGELPDRTFEEAGRLAAWYSKGHSAPKVEIDYIQKKHVKKPAGAKPGFVVYYTNYSLMASPDISGLKEVTE